MMIAMMIMMMMMESTKIKDRKSTRLNSSHSQISYAVFCLKKKKPADEEHVRFPNRELCHALQAISRVILLRVHAVVDYGHPRSRDRIRPLDVRLHVPRGRDDRVAGEETLPFHPGAELVPGAQLLPFPRPQGFERMDRGDELGPVDAFRHGTCEIRVPCVGVHDRRVNRIRDHVHVE